MIHIYGCQAYATKTTKAVGVPDTFPEVSLVWGATANYSNILNIDLGALPFP